MTGPDEIGPEGPHVLRLGTSEQVTQRAADLVCEQIRRRPQGMLGLPTGDTPRATHAELVLRYRRGEVSFRQVRTFDLDEYVGLDGPPSPYFGGTRKASR